jgi:DNA invertase Pin-like site-specific DNA recombinase
MRVAIYAGLCRVSTESKGPDPEKQLRDLRAWCANSGHDLVGEYIDRVGGRKDTGERRRFAALFKEAAAAASSIVSCSGRSTASAARAWCRRSITSSGSTPTA